MQGDGENCDSGRIGGGSMPGSPGRAAFFLSGPVPSAIPVLLAVPHAGRDYPRGLLRAMRNPRTSMLRLEDRYVDLVAQGVARESGAGMIVAQAPRAMIDLNRSTDDIDWEMLPRAARPHDIPAVASQRARSGLGLVPRRLPGMGEIWRQRMDPAELHERVDGVHTPYHGAIEAALAGLRARWGAALLLDIHSMPPLAPRIGQPTARIVIGDRFGATCHGQLTGTTFAHFAQAGIETAHNRPYAGGYVLERHARPHQRIFALQLEIDRSLDLDGDMVEPGEGLAGVVAVLTGLVRRLACEVGELGQADRDVPGWGTADDWPLAAQ